ncbi:MAG: glycosyltransferase involved in cell wall biosynthesis [Cryomorphaceae bacterium]|jgi:glycosyltransferase involved in cell wall biosynthesis
MEMNPIAPSLTIVIPTVGKRNVLDPTLERLKKAVGNQPIEVLIVDDSKAGNLDEKDVEPFNLLKSGGHGAANARNIGWKAARAKLLLFLDDDIWITEQNLQRTFELHEQEGPIAYNFFWVYPDQLMTELNKSAFGKYILKRKLYSNAHRLDFDHQSKKGMVKMNGLTSQYFSIEKRWIEASEGYNQIPFAGIEDLMLYDKLKALGVQVMLSLDDTVFQYEVNKLSSDSLVSRYRTGALTRRVASNAGHIKHGVNFNGGQKVKGLLGHLFEPVLIAIESIMPFGSIYERVVNYRLFIATYRGYYRDELPSHSPTPPNQK